MTPEPVAERIRRDVARALDELAIRLPAQGMPILRRTRGTLLYRRRDERIGNVVILDYSRPSDRGHAALCPLVYRFAVDYYDQHTPGRLSLVRAPGGGFELSCLPDELAPLAAWLPSWIVARDEGAPPPAPPIEMRGPHLVDYAWTQTAWDAYAAWWRARPQATAGGGAA